MERGQDVGARVCHQLGVRFFFGESEHGIKCGMLCFSLSFEIPVSGAGNFADRTLWSRVKVHYELRNEPLSRPGNETGTSGRMGRTFVLMRVFPACVSGHPGPGGLHGLLPFV